MLLEDPFEDAEEDPLKSKAEESSLWELQVLEIHFVPAVSKLVGEFKKDYRKIPAPLPPPGSVDDFVEMNFTDLFQAEFRRKTRKNPLAYDAPDTDAAGMVEKQLSSSIVWS